MKIRQAKTTDLAKARAGYNPRKISEHEMGSLRRSIRYFGMVEPIVFNRRTKRVVGGFQRIEAARLEGIETLPTFDIDVDEPTEKQLNLALNRIHGTWDEDRLAALLAELQASGAGMALTGFRESEIEKYIATLRDVPTAEDDQAPEVPAKARSKAGDLWTLGEHRIFCGDSADPKSVAAVLGLARPALLIGDPPAGAECHANLREAAKTMPAGAAAYIVAPDDRSAAAFQEAFERAGLEWHQTLIWSKDTMIRVRFDYNAQHECIIYGWKPGKHYFIADRTRTTILEAAPPAGARQIPGMKPLALWEELIGNSTTPGQAILDPYLGSGTTIIACERLGRRGFGIEIEPRFVDVAVDRWQETTGLEATRGKTK